MSEGRVIPVEINGQRYPIRSTLDPEYVARLAVLAALNIADELFRCRDHTRARDGHLAERTEEIERMVDRVLLA